MTKLLPKDFFHKYGAWIGLILLSIVLAVLTKGDFATSRNLTNLFRQAALNGVLACGMTLIIITGGIDLSIGSIVALAGVVAGISQTQWGFAEMGYMGAILSMGLATLTGGGAGAVSGALVANLGIAPFVITLGMMVMGRGLALIFSGGSAISPMSEQLNVFANHYFGSTGSFSVMGLALAYGVFSAWKKRWAGVAAGLLLAGLTLVFHLYRGIPVLVVFLALIAGTSHFLLNFTVLGRSIFAVGSNARAAYWAGVAIKRTHFLVYLLMGLFAGLTGALLASRLNSADPNAGQLFELDAIAAVVIGGTSLKGGVGTITGSLVGALMIAALNNGMDLLGVPSFYQMVFKGLIIIVAVALDRSQRQTA